MLRALMGAATGLVVACLAVVVGAIGVVLALLRGARVTFEGFGGIVFYGAGFVAAGLVAGILLPIARFRGGRYVVGVLSAVSGLTLLMRGFKGPFSHWTGADLSGLLVLSLLFGITVPVLLLPAAEPGAAGDVRPGIAPE